VVERCKELGVTSTLSQVARGYLCRQPPERRTPCCDMRAFFPRWTEPMERNLPLLNRTQEFAGDWADDIAAGDFLGPLAKDPIA